MQIAVPSRTQIEDYRRVKAQVECAVERINTRFGVGTAKPIHYRYIWNQRSWWRTTAWRTSPW